MENTGIQPVMPIGGYGYGDGWGGGNGCFMWVILLFALMGGGFGGWGNRGDVASTRDVYASNDFQSLRSAVNNLGNGIADATFALNNTINNGFNNTGRDIAQGTYVMDKAVTDTRYVLGNAINENRFASQQNANMIAKAIADDGEKTRALIVQNKIEALQMALAEKDRRLLSSDFALSQCGQTREIISQVRPFPVPAFPVGNPYGSGCNCGCGVYNA